MTDRDAMLHFLCGPVGLCDCREYDRPERGDICQFRQGQLTLELFIKSTAPERVRSSRLSM